MKAWIAFWLGFFQASCAVAAFNVDQLYINYEHFHDNEHDAFLDPEGIWPHEALNLGVDLDLFAGVRWDSLVLSETDTGQYRTISLDTRLYLAVSPSVEIGYHHVSRHLLDMSPVFHFPVQDALEFRWVVYKAQGSRVTLLH